MRNASLCAASIALCLTLVIRMSANAQTGGRGVVVAPPAAQAMLILSLRDQTLAINAWDGARHGTVLRLHNGCQADNPDCLWIYRDKMLVSARNQQLAINAWGGAANGVILRLHEACQPRNPDCTWTRRDGMYVSDRNPSLAINAWGGALHGTVLRLSDACHPNNSDCTWTAR